MEIFQLLERDSGASPAEVCAWLDRLRSVLPSCDVHEIGSTAIAGVIGKQDVDLLVRCDSTDFAQACEILDAEFERNPTQFSSEEFQGYRVASEFDVAIQVTVRGCTHDRFLDFRDLMRGNPEIVEQYNALKRHWNGRSMAEYREAKALFIEHVLVCLTPCSPP